MKHTTALSVLSLVLGASAARDGHCPPLGPVLPPPTNPSSSASVQAAIKTVKETLSATASNFNQSAVAVGVKSIHETGPLMNYFYTPPTFDSRGVSEVNADTVFRLASLSKVFPVTALLKLEVNFNDAVTDYIPELRDLNKHAREQTAIWTVDWDDVTIGALSSHLGGIPADLSLDLSLFGNFTKLGFPPLDPAGGPNCSGVYNTTPCTWEDFEKWYGERPPVYKPFSQNAVYANAAWGILGHVIEVVSGKPAGEYIQESIWEPLAMSHSYTSTPNASLGFIPVDSSVDWDAHDWNSKLGFEDPAGSYFSSLNDLTAFGNGILANKLLSPAKTRKWLKPVTGTSSRGIMIGEPWEIFRVTNITKDERTIDIYTKGGDLILYHSMLAMIPDYDLVVTILVGGTEVSGGVVEQLLADILKGILPGLEAAGKEEVEPTLIGTYSDPGTNSSLTLSLDDSPGISVTEWTVRGVDIINLGYPNMNFFPPEDPQAFPPGLVRMRLFSTGLSTEKQSSWRALATAGSAEDLAASDATKPWLDATCFTWASMDRLSYQLQGYDHFVFTVNDNGETELELVGFRATLKRASK